MENLPPAPGQETTSDSQYISRSEFMELKEQLQAFMRMFQSMNASPTSSQPVASQHTPPPQIPVDPNHASTSGGLPRTIPPSLPTGLMQAPPVVLPNDEVDHYAEVAHSEKIEDKLNSKISSIEKSIRAIHGIDLYGGTEYSDLCLFPEVQLPAKFKVPDFTKYDGTGCPYTHLKIYCGELGAPGNNEKLRMQLFQKSLTGSALRWFVEDYGKFKTWNDLTSLFLQQYRFNNDIAPDRFELQRMTKKSSESFREYAQRWREMAARVKPPLEEKEMVNTFIHTLPGFYYDKLFTCVGKPFADLIRNGEMLDDGVRTGKIKIPEIQSLGNIRRPAPIKSDKKESTVSAILPNQSSTLQLPTHSNSTTKPVTLQNQMSSQQKYYEERKRRTFTPLGCTQLHAYNLLVAAGHIQPIPARPVPNPPPRSYDPSLKCEYHSGSIGHSTESCFSLKHKIQDLIEAGHIKLAAQSEQPNVQTNPLPTHSTNMVSSHESDFDPAILIGRQGEMVRVFSQSLDIPSDVCVVQEGRQTHQITHPITVPTNQAINPRVVILPVAPIYQLPHQISLPPVVLPSTSTSQLSQITPSSPLILPKPKVITISPPIQNTNFKNNQVPWNYNIESITETGEVIQVNEPTVAELGGFTRSGRCYSPEELQKQMKNKEKESPKNANMPVTPNEASEFLKVLKKSEYNVVAQPQPLRFWENTLHQNTSIQTSNTITV